MRTMIRCLLIAACAAPPVLSATGVHAMGGGPPTAAKLENPQSWAGPLEEATAAGMEREAVLTALAQLENSGYPPDAAGPILTPAIRAAEQRLPAEWVLTKIGEGALKKVPAAELETAARQRAALLQEARTLLERARVGPAGDGGLLRTTATALESGVPETVLRTVFEHAEGHTRSRRQLETVVEAGEAFHLAGLDDGSVGALMVDCLDRNLRRIETQRVVRYVRDHAHRGIPGPQLRSNLWTDHATPRPGAGRGPGGPDRAAGAAAGGARGPGSPPGPPGGGIRGGGGPPGSPPGGPPGSPQGGPR